MAEPLTIEITGLEELQKKKEAIAKHLSSGQLVARAALIIERKAKENATGRPGPHVQTGRLRASIMPIIESPFQAKVGTNVFYAPYVEFGHIQHPGQFVPPLRRRLVSAAVRAYPFFFRSIEETKELVGDTVKVFAQEIQGIWGGMG